MSTTAATVTSTRKTELDGTAIALLVVCCLFWGFQQVLVKATLPEVAPVYQAALRFAGATALLWLWCRQRGLVLFARDGTWPAGVLAGSLFAGEFITLYLGLQYSSASRLTVFLYTSPFWVAVLLPLFVATEHLRRIQWVGLGCAFAAVVYAVSEGFASSNPQQWLGDLLALCAGMLWGLTTITIRSTRLAQVGAEQMLFYQIGISALTMPFVSLALGETWTLHFSPFALTSLLVQTVVGAFASYLAWMWMLGRYPATKISVFVFLTPLFALLFGALWLHESITPGLIAAMGLVTLGIVLVNRR